MLATSLVWLSLLASTSSQGPKVLREPGEERRCSRGNVPRQATEGSPPAAAVAAVMVAGAEPATSGAT